MTNYIAYYRISTASQMRANNISLGIEAQKTSVRNFIGANGAILHEHVEIESGKNNNRPVLEKAIQQAQKTGATLIIAKLDRLSREVSFLFQLRDRVQQSGVSIKSLDIPDMNTLNLGIYSTISQHERETISTRTKNALSELRKQGVKLGNPKNLTPDAIQKGISAVRENAKSNDNNRQAQAMIKSCVNQDMSYNKIASYLNELNFKTRYNKTFQATTVMRLYKRHLNDNLKVE
ncbi:MAG: recombinase family protein [Bacteroidota bacterium]|nr:recombinase family protein [Bacteroidota bacterium]